MRNASRLVLPAVVLVFTVAVFTVGLLAYSESPPVKSCATPTPEGGTIPMYVDVLELAAVSNITLTTVYTLMTTQGGIGYTTRHFLAYPDCRYAGISRYADLVSFKPQRFILESEIYSPDNFIGVIYVLSGSDITGTSEIVSKITPTITPTPRPASVYVPLVLVAPTATRTGDMDAPHLARWSFAPLRINVLESSQVITFTARFTDDLSGLIISSSAITATLPQAQFESPSLRQSRFVYFRHPSNLVSGTANNGTYQAAIAIPRSAEAGEWKVDFLLLTDNAGNRRILSRADLVRRGLLTSFFVEN